LPVLLQTGRLGLMLPHPGLAAAMLDFAMRNQPHLRPWSPPAPANFHALEYWQDNILATRAAFDAGSMVRLLMLPASAPDKIIGSIGFSQIARGPFCSCMLGYQIDQAYEGQGLMHEALQAAIRYMFQEQKLHRIGANYMPHNIRSGRLLARLGFHIDGYAKNYLFIDGAWRDHILTSLVNDAFRPEWLA
jgi:ribosomal-protein-alanine N-acetyltransferase